jgi:hypothetical protein
LFEQFKSCPVAARDHDSVEKIREELQRKMRQTPLDETRETALGNWVIPYPDLGQAPTHFRPLEKYNIQTNNISNNRGV